MNRWMNDANVLAQIGHTLGGAWLVTLPCLFAGARVWWTAWLAVAFYAAIKEFWYDARYELPRQSWNDNITDFAFYQVGAALGSSVVFLAQHLHRIS